MRNKLQECWEDVKDSWPPLAIAFALVAVIVILLIPWRCDTSECHAYRDSIEQVEIIAQDRMADRQYHRVRYDDDMIPSIRFYDELCTTVMISCGNGCMTPSTTCSETNEVDVPMTLLPEQDNARIQCLLSRLDD